MLSLFRYSVGLLLMACSTVMSADAAPEVPRTWIVADIKSGPIPPPAHGASATLIGADY